MKERKKIQKKEKQKRRLYHAEERKATAPQLKENIKNRRAAVNNEEMKLENVW